jgi:hypothetical protein
MNRTRSRVLATINHKIRGERVRPIFTPLPLLAQLDLKKVVARPSINMELGYLSAGLCRQTVRASVKKGIVTGIQLDPCTPKNAQKPSAELLQLIRKAHRALARTGQPAWYPIPISDFLKDASRIIIETITCIQICIPFTTYCIYCCTTIPSGFVCGGDVVVMPPIIIYF